MTESPGLFDVPPLPARPPGPVRTGLETSITAATAGGTALSAAGIAGLRTLADQLDRVETLLNRSAKPYDSMPLVALHREFREAFADVFAAVSAAEDPISRALDDFLAGESGRT